MSKERILNPKTNRMILADSKLGREIKKLDIISDVIDVVDVNEEDVQKFEEEIKPTIDEETILKNKKEYFKIYYEANKDKIIERTRTRYKLNRVVKEKKEKVIDNKEYLKNYYQLNKDKIKDRSNNRYKIKKEIKVIQQ